MRLLQKTKRVSQLEKDCILLLEIPFHKDGPRFNHPDLQKVEDFERWHPCTDFYTPLTRGTLWLCPTRNRCADCREPVDRTEDMKRFTSSSVVQRIFPGVHSYAYTPDSFRWYYIPTKP